MAVTVRVNSSQKLVEILIRERLDFSMYKEFRQAYRYVTDKRTRFVVDFKDASFIDSAGIGMLLLLRQHARSVDGSLQVVNTTGAVRRVLEMIHFSDM